MRQPGRQRRNLSLRSNAMRLGCLCCLASEAARWLVRSEAKHGKRLVVALNTVYSVEAFAARRVCKG